MQGLNATFSLPAKQFPRPQRTIAQLAKTSPGQNNPRIVSFCSIGYKISECMRESPAKSNPPGRSRNKSWQFYRQLSFATSLQAFQKSTYQIINHHWSRYLEEVICIWNLNQLGVLKVLSEEQSRLSRDLLTQR
jgi:hypothetical protein